MTNFSVKHVFLAAILVTSLGCANKSDEIHPANRNGVVPSPSQGPVSSAPSGSSSDTDITPVAPTAPETPTPPGPGVPCTRRTACPSAMNCGTVEDGCGGTVACGTCPAGQTCGYAGIANVCGPLLPAPPTPPPPPTYQMIFVSDRDGASNGYQQDISCTGDVCATGGLRNLTNNTSRGTNYFRPAAKPDGTKVAFSTMMTFGRIFLPGLIIGDLTADPPRFTPYTGDLNATGTRHGYVMSVAWNPLGTKLAFSYSDTGDREYGIKIDNTPDNPSDADFTRVASLDATKETMGEFSWSPITNPSSHAFERVAYATTYTNNTPHFHYIYFWCDRSECRYVTALMAGGDHNGDDVEEPALSPDATRMAYVFKDHTTGRSHIMLCNINDHFLCSSITPLTTGDWDDTSPAWTPDGRRILFASTRDGNSEIYIIDADGTHARNLTNNPAADIDPTVSPVSP